MDKTITAFLAILLLPWLICGQQLTSCPHTCRCSHHSNGYLVNCSLAGLTHVPIILPSDTQHLDLSYNSISAISDNAFDGALHLLSMDLRHNTPHVTALPPMWHHANLSVIHADEGAACCMYETDWKLSKYKKAPAACYARIPYNECDHKLVKVGTLIIYGIVIVISFICNPWIIIVTIFYRPRRTDVVTLNSVNFCCANILSTIYAAVMFGYGIAFYGSYHHHMYGWLHNHGCGVVGFMLITSTLCTAVFYMLEVVLIYQKLRWPLHIDRHMRWRQLAGVTAATWFGAALVAAVPLFTATKGQYNRVGLCLPFYSGDYNFEFKYVILYTTVININLITVITLTVLLLRSIVKNGKQWYGEVPRKVAERNKALQQTLLIALFMYILINVVLVSFLIMSCVGGSVGKTGREWFSRLVVLEAATNPLLGTIRKKIFLRDTKRLLKRWGLLKWNTADELGSDNTSSTYQMRKRAISTHRENDKGKSLMETQ